MKAFNMERICTKCGEKKSENDFYYIRTRSCYMSRCKVCIGAYRNVRIKERRKIVNTKEWYYRRYSHLKLAAIARGIEFHLTCKEHTQLISQFVCFYCNEEAQIRTVDRKDNTKGYFYENCVMACFTCNKLKSNLNKSGLDAIRKRLTNIIEKM